MFPVKIRIAFALGTTKLLKNPKKKIFLFSANATSVLLWCPGPEIDPFWYVGRGVRPIGRFGKRHISVEALGRGGMQPVVRMLALLLNGLRNKENLGNVLDEEDRDWLP